MNECMNCSTICICNVSGRLIHVSDTSSSYDWLVVKRMTNVFMLVACSTRPSSFRLQFFGYLQHSACNSQKSTYHSFIIQALQFTFHLYRRTVGLVSVFTFTFNLVRITQQDKQFTFLNEYVSRQDRGIARYKDLQKYVVL